jgi:hypothetical protein
MKILFAIYFYLMSFAMFVGSILTMTSDEPDKRENMKLGAICFVISVGAFKIALLLHLK